MKTRIKRNVGIIASLIVVVLLSAGGAQAGEGWPITVSQKDKCPVCGMFVKKYPDWIAAMVFKDGSYAVFDGAKDLFKCYHNPGKYLPGRSQADIQAVYVTDYYALEPTDGYTAHYVAGSDVYGPMGKELIPFGKAADAKGFLKDHKGKSILKFREIGPDVVKSLD